MILEAFTFLLLSFLIYCSGFKIEKNNPSLISKSLLKVTTQSLQFSPNKDYELSLISPCKINLFLRITGKRPNGYHDLASLFQTVSLCDFMHFSKLPEGSIKDELVCSDSSLQIDESNLVIKALNLMREKSSVKNAYFKVRLDKIVPMQAGLGGGSGNAATAMYAFNKLTGLKSSLEDLRKWSGDIGSDITFFFSSGTAYCTGRGEIIEPLAQPPKSNDVRVHIFKPTEGLSTKLVFQNLDINTMCSKTDPIKLRDLFMSEGALRAASLGGLENDLEPPAFKCSPSLLNLKKSIISLFLSDSELLAVEKALSSNSGGRGESVVMMSGSGTSIYGLSDPKAFSQPDKASRLEKLLNANEGLKYFDCAFINKANDVSSWYS